MRSLILILLGLSVASAGGYYYGDSVPAQYRFWQFPQVVELQRRVLNTINPQPVDIAVLEIVTPSPEIQVPKAPKAELLEPELELDMPVVAHVDEAVVSEHNEQVEKDARNYVSDLSYTQQKNVAVKTADHFVGANQILELLQGDTFVELLAPLESTPIIQTLAHRPKTIISKLGADFDTDGAKELVLIQTASSTDLQPMLDASLEEYPRAIDEPGMIVRQASVNMPVLPEIIEAGKRKDANAVSGNTPQITIAELLKDEEPAKEGSIYYVRTVKSNDKQGIWGIIVNGLTENFANGIAISRDESVDTYQVQIPRLSDDMLPDNTSSFLGKLVDRKTRECFVYNFVEKKIGRNPDLIYPGQELLIINFEAQELIDIYTHFVENS